jgi:hypothetical protein
MSCTFAQLRTAVSTKVLTVAGMHLTNFPPGYFLRMQNTIAHKAFVVSLRTSTDSNERQRLPVGIYLTTTVEVQYAYRLRPMDIYPTDYDASLNLEEQIIRAVLGSYSGIQAGIELRYNRSTRTVVDSLEYMVHALEFTALHTLPTS